MTRKLRALVTPTGRTSWGTFWDSAMCSALGSTSMPVLIAIGMNGDTKFVSTIEGASIDNTRDWVCVFIVTGK